MGEGWGESRWILKEGFQNKEDTVCARVYIYTYIYMYIYKTKSIRRQQAMIFLKNEQKT